MGQLFFFDFVKDVLFVRAENLLLCKCSTAGIFEPYPFTVLGKTEVFAGCIVILMMLFLYALYRCSIPDHSLSLIMNFLKSVPILWGRIFYFVENILLMCESLNGKYPVRGQSPRRPFLKKGE
jgi:hypothetical protein